MILLKDIFLPEIQQLIFEEFGGPLLQQSHAKSKRPISRRWPMHFVLQSKLAKGPYSFLKKQNRKKIINVLRRHKHLVELKNIKISSQQVELIMGCKEKDTLHHFLRIFTGLIARQILGAEKAQAKIKNQKFWNFRPYSRILRRYQQTQALQKKLIFHFLKIGLIVKRKSLKGSFLNSS